MKLPDASALGGFRPRIVRIMLHLFLFILALYLLLIIIGFAISEKILFPIQPKTYLDSGQILKLKTSDGIRISAIYLPNPKARFTILFSHGNAEDLGNNKEFFETMRNRGFSVFAYDYHGYGTSEGKPTEKNTYLDIEAAYKYLVEELNISPDKIIIHGRSVGSGPSTHLAFQKPVGGLILESPVATAFCVLTRYRMLPFDKFCNIDKINRVNCPVLIIHARNDEIVPFSHGMKLYSKAREPKMHFWVKDGGHNSLLQAAGDRYWLVLDEFRKLILARSPDQQDGDLRPISSK